MNHPIRSVVVTALALLLVGGLVAWTQEGGRFALGLALTGLVTLGSLGMGAVALARVGDGTHASSRVLAVPFVLKLPLLLGAGWLLLDNFPPLSVILGGTALVASITLHAAL